MSDEERRLSRSEMRTYARAFRERWEGVDSLKEMLVRRVGRMLEDPSTTNREVNAAGRLVVAMESQNQKDQHRIIDAEDRPGHFDTAAIAQQLGIDPRVIEHAPAQADRGAEGSVESDSAGDEETSAESSSDKENSGGTRSENREG